MTERPKVIGTVTPQRFSERTNSDPYLFWGLAFGQSCRNDPYNVRRHMGYMRYQRAKFDADQLLHWRKVHKLTHTLATIFDCCPFHFGAPEDIVPRPLMRKGIWRLWLTTVQNFTPIGYFTAEKFLTGQTTTQKTSV